MPEIVLRSTRRGRDRCGRLDVVLRLHDGLVGGVRVPHLLLLRTASTSAGHRRGVGVVRGQRVDLGQLLQAPEWAKCSAAGQGSFCRMVGGGVIQGGARHLELGWTLGNLGLHGALLKKLLKSHLLAWQ